METKFDPSYCKAFKGAALPENGLILNSIRSVPNQGLGSRQNLKDVFSGQCDALLSVGSSTYLLINPTDAAQRSAETLNTVYDTYKADPNKFELIGPFKV